MPVGITDKVPSGDEEWQSVAVPNSGGARRGQYGVFGLRVLTRLPERYRAAAPPISSCCATRWAVVGLPARSPVQTAGQGGGLPVGTELDVTVRRHGQIVVVHPRGSLTLRASRVLHRVLVNELLGNGRVVVDLDGFQLAHPPRVMMFADVLTECGGWPAVKIALCRPGPEMAQALSTRGVAVQVPVYHLLLEAEAEIDRRPEVVRTSTRLPGDVGNRRSARR